MLLHSRRRSSRRSRSSCRRREWKVGEIETETRSTRNKNDNNSKRQKPTLFLFLSLTSLYFILSTLASSSSIIITGVHANSQRCKVDNDCQYQNQGQRCMNHTCLYICQSDDNCPLSGVCKTNVCNWNGSKVPILPSKINNGTTGTNSTSSVAVGDVVLDRTSVQGDNTTSTNTSSSITPTLSVNNTKDNDDNGGDKKFFSNELTKSIAVIMLGVLIVGLAITALCCVRRVSTKKYGEKSGQDYNDDNTYHNRNIVTPDVMTNIHDENDSPYQFIEQHKHRQQSSLHQKQPHPHMRESSFEEAHLHATGGDLDSEEISPLPLQPQLTFTEQTLYGSHGASTSSVDLKSTSQYPYLSQHHFMSSE